MNTTPETLLADIGKGGGKCHQANLNQEADPAAHWLDALWYNNSSNSINEPRSVGRCQWAAR